MSERQEEKKQDKTDPVGEELLQELTRLLGQYEGEVLQDKRAELFGLLDRLEPGYQEPAISSMAWSELNDKRRCDNLRLEPAELDIATYLQNGYVEQTVYLSQHIWVTYRSARPLDSQFLDAWSHQASKRYEALGEKKDLKSSEMVDLMNATPTAEAMQELAVAVVRVNDQPLDDVKDIYVLGEDGYPVPKLELALRKQRVLVAMPSPVTTDIMINLRLFQQRVHRLHAPEAVQAF